jgi:hydroxymethylpyrimidine pyrophosphatase-like HAD family hydrolase
MRCRVLATDYDGTLALNGHVDEPTVAALRRFLASGRQLVLVTGRELQELLGILPEISLFERVLAENGALLYRPATREALPLAGPPPDELVQRLTEEGVRPLSIGQVIVATWEANENAVRRAIGDLGLDLQVICNKGAVMVLPANVDKATGLAAALNEMGLYSHQCASIGDAENDFPLLRMCPLSAAVANALPALKEAAGWVTTADHGAGVTEFIEKIMATDF